MISIQRRKDRGLLLFMRRLSLTDPSAEGFSEMHNQKYVENNYFVGVQKYLFNAFLYIDWVNFLKNLQNVLKRGFWRRFGSFVAENPKTLQSTPPPFWAKMLKSNPFRGGGRTSIVSSAWTFKGTRTGSYASLPRMVKNILIFKQIFTKMQKSSCLLISVFLSHDSDQKMGLNHNPKCPFKLILCKISEVKQNLFFWYFTYLFLFENLRARGSGK